MGTKARLTVAACAFAAWNVGALAAPETIAPANVWPQARSDIPADPNITFGTLPSGMRYLIEKGANPAHGVSLRFRIAAGSLEEPADEKGIAHLLEHMAFRGSKHLKDGAAVKMLESMGVSLAADMNAHTYPDSTTFEFDLPNNDKASIDKGLTFLREVASNLTLSPKAVASERKVVTAEIQEKNSAALHMSLAYLKQTLGPSLANGMYALGNVDFVEKATAAQLQKFYRTYYRPNRATLLIIGDVDPKAMAAEIKARFGNWKAASPEPKPVTYPAPGTASTPGSEIFSEPGAPALVRLSWATPFDNAPDSIAKARHGIVRTIALGILNLRLEKLAQSDKPPFIAAAAKYSQSFGAADIANLSAAYKTGNAAAAQRALHDVYAAALKSGVQQSEIDEAVAQLHTRYRSMVAVFASLPDKTLASIDLIMIGTGQVIDMPQESLALFEETVKNLTPVKIDAVLHETFSGNPKVFVSRPLPAGSNVSKLTTVFPAPSTASQNAAPAAPAKTPAPIHVAATMKWPYTNFGTASAIVSRKTVPDLGVTMVTFANGVRATIKPTKFLAGQVSIAVRFGGGRLSLPKDRPSPSWAFAGSLIGGGLKGLSPADMNAVLSDKQWGVKFKTADDAYELLGQTHTPDFDTEMQVLAAYMQDPAWRAQGFARVRAAWQNALGQIDGSPSAKFGLEYWSANHNNDPRWVPPSAKDLQDTNLQAVKAILEPALANGPISIIVVGDVSVADAIKEIGATFGSFAKRPLLTKPFAGDEHLPTASQFAMVIPYHGNGSQAVALIGWPTSGMFFDTKALARQAVLKSVLQGRLFDQVRTQLGMTYTPRVQLDNSSSTARFGFITLESDVPDTKIKAFYDVAAKIVAALKTTRISQAELVRARKPVVDDLEHARSENGYWLGHLVNAQIDPRRIALLRNDLAMIKAVSAKDIQSAARTYLSNGKAWKIEVVPADFKTPVAAR